MRIKDLLVIGLCLLIASMMLSGTNSMPVLLTELKGTQVVPSERVDHEPFIIDGNADMLAQKSENDWEGTGEDGSPIIIADYRIEFYDQGITIRNVDLHFLIDNCEFAGVDSFIYHSAGIRLYNCENGVISNSEIDVKETGIFIRDSNHIEVTGTSVHNCSAGISVENCNYVNIGNNDFSWNDFVGVNITNSYASMVYNNSILANPYFGVMCIVDTGTYLVNNVISSTDLENGLIEHVGVFSFYSTNIAMHNTKISDCFINLEMQHTNGSWVWESCFLGAREYGIYLHEDTYNVTVVECCIVPFGGVTAYDAGEANSWDNPYDEIGNWWSDWNGTDYYYVSGPAGSIDHYPNLFSCDCWGSINTTTTTTTNITWFEEGVEPIVLVISIGSSVIIIIVIVLIMKSSRSP